MCVYIDLYTSTTSAPASMERSSESNFVFLSSLSRASSKASAGGVETPSEDEEDVSFSVFVDTVVLSGMVETCSGSPDGVDVDVGACCSTSGAGVVTATDEEDERVGVNTCAEFAVKFGFGTAKTFRLPICVC